MNSLNQRNILFDQQVVPMYYKASELLKPESSIWSSFQHLHSGGIQTLMSHDNKKAGRLVLNRWYWNASGGLCVKFMYLWKNCSQFTHLPNFLQEIVLGVEALHAIALLIQSLQAHFLKNSDSSVMTTGKLEESNREVWGGVFPIPGVNQNERLGDNRLKI